MNTRVSNIMNGKHDNVVVQILAAMDFEGMQQLQQQVVAAVVGPTTNKTPEEIAAAEALAHRLFKKRMLHLTTTLQPWPAPRALTAEEIAWLGAAGVRTKVHFEKKPIDVPQRYRKSLGAVVLASAIVWHVNGNARLLVNTNGEFWMAPAGTPVPAAAPPPTFPPLMVLDPKEVSNEEHDRDLNEDEDELEPRDDPHYLMIHRVGGPAVRDFAGFELWARRGMPHRVDGPAVIRPMSPGEEIERLYFFRGTQVANQEAVTAAAAAAAPDPVFDDDRIDHSDTMPPHMVLPAEWRTALSSAAPLPLPRSFALKEPPFVPNATLRRLLSSRVPVRSIEFPPLLHIPHILHLDPAKPLGDAVREDLLTFLAQPMSEAELNTHTPNNGAWHSFAGKAMMGLWRVQGLVTGIFSEDARLVAVTTNGMGGVRLRVSSNSMAPEAEWTLPDT